MERNYSRGDPTNSICHLLQMAMQKLQMVAARRLAVSSLQRKVPVRWLRSHNPTICLDVLSGAAAAELLLKYSVAGRSVGNASPMLAAYLP